MVERRNLYLFHQVIPAKAGIPRDDSILANFSYMLVTRANGEIPAAAGSAILRILREIKKMQT